MDFSAFRRRFHRRLRERALSSTPQLDELASELLSLLRVRREDAPPIFAELADGAKASPEAIVALGEAAVDARLAPPEVLVALTGEAVARVGPARPAGEPLLAEILATLEEAVLLLDAAGAVTYQ